MHSRFSPCQRQIAVAMNWLAPAVFLGGSVLLAAIVIGPQGLEAQEQIDVLDRAKRAAAAIADLSLRVRVTRVAPAADSLLIDWRH